MRLQKNVVPKFSLSPHISLLPAVTPISTYAVILHRLLSRNSRESEKLFLPFNVPGVLGGNEKTDTLAFIISKPRRAPSCSSGPPAIQISRIIGKSSFAASSADNTFRV
jgi:hypothetical protein